MRVGTHLPIHDADEARIYACPEPDSEPVWLACQSDWRASVIRDAIEPEAGKTGTAARGRQMETGRERRE
jgi:hypothetical protein